MDASKDSPIYDELEMGSIKKAETHHSMSAPSLVKTDDLSEAMELIENGTYSLTRERGCQMLRVHLEFWSASIHPLLAHIKLRGTGKATTTRGFVINYGPQYTPPGSGISGYYHYSLEALKAYVDEHLQIFRRTKRIVLDDYVEDAAAWKKARSDLRSQMPDMSDRSNKARNKYLAWRKKCTKAIKEALPENKRFLMEERIGSDNRSGMEWVAVEDPALKELAWNKLLACRWSSPSTERAYGQAATAGFRRIHTMGGIRLELPFGDKLIVRYIEDPDWKDPQGVLDEQPLFLCTISWQAYTKLNDIMEKEELPF